VAVATRVAAAAVARTEAVNSRLDRSAIFSRTRTHGDHLHLSALRCPRDTDPPPDSCWPATSLPLPLVNQNFVVISGSTKSLEHIADRLTDEHSGLWSSALA
jgi:hypothetical protein